MAAQLPYRDRREAGRALASLLGAYAGRGDVLVLGLPRGGVPVAFEVALALRAPLDVFLVRKLGVPGHEELAMGAIASGGTRVLNWEVVRQLGITPEAVERVAAREAHELARREAVYRAGRPPPPIAGACVLLVDDGLATGSTMRAAAVALHRRRPARCAIAVPVAASATCAELRPEADEVVCAATPEPFGAVGLWYVDFAAVSDEEVSALLAQAAQRGLSDQPVERTGARGERADPGEGGESGHGQG